MIQTFWRNMSFGVAFAESYFIRRPIFNLNVNARFGLQIYSSCWRSNIKRNFVMKCSNCKLQSSNFVGSISISCNPVSTNDDGWDLLQSKLKLNQIPIKMDQFYWLLKTWGMLLTNHKSMSMEFFQTIVRMQ